MATEAIPRPAHGTHEQTGLLAWLLTTDHKKIGIMYLVFTILFLMIKINNMLNWKAELGYFVGFVFVLFFKFSPCNLVIENNKVTSV